MQHEMHCLRDEHKVTLYLWMRYRHRSSPPDLLQKAWYHAAIAPQHIAKAYHHKTRLMALRQTLHEQFCHPLGSPHDAGRIDCLISRDENKTLRPKMCGCFSHPARSTHIVLHRFTRVQFHQRHMLMGCSVEHDLG